jgi:adenylosuccinate synthase
VTSSNCGSGGACTGLGVGPNKIENVLGVTKAYTTRVGLGPFPAEFEGEMGDVLRELGKEYGATTGRPRRCGWLDLVVVNFAIRINGIEQLAVTKLDVLDSLDEIKVCVAYDIDGEKRTNFPADLELLERAKPVYETFPGWKTDTSAARSYEDLPDNARNYLETVEKLTGAQVSIISVGPGREQTIIR